MNGQVLVYKWSSIGLWMVQYRSTNGLQMV